MAKLLESSLHQQSTAHSFPSIFGSAPRLTERIDRARQTSQSGASTSGRDHCKVLIILLCGCSCGTMRLKRNASQEGTSSRNKMCLSIKTDWRRCLCTGICLNGRWCYRLAQLGLELRHLTTQSSVSIS